MANVDELALVWRELGQPEIEGMMFVCEHGSEWYDHRTLLGYPIVVGLLHGSDVPLAIVAPNMSPVVASHFESIARGRL